MVRGARSLIGGDAGAHRHERLDDAPHGAAPERVVAGQRHRERVRGEDAAHQAQRGPRVASVEDAGRRLEAAEAAPVYSDREVGPRQREGDAEPLEAGGRGGAVGSGGVVPDRGTADRECGQHGVAVGDGLVAGNADPARNLGRGAHQGFAERGHPVTIPRDLGLTRKDLTAVRTAAPEPGTLDRGSGLVLLKRVT